MVAETVDYRKVEGKRLALERRKSEEARDLVIVKRVSTSSDKVSEGIMTTKEEREQREFFYHLKEIGLGFTTVCTFIFVMAIVFKGMMAFQTRNTEGSQAYVACVMSLIVGMSGVVSVLYYCAPAVADKAEAQSSALVNSSCTAVKEGSVVREKERSFKW